MKKVLRWFLIVLGSALVVLQFIRPPRNHAAETPLNTVAQSFPVSEGVQSLLRQSCYDCHSNTTIYPWYAEIQPVGWWLNSHIVAARQEVNFDEFGSYRAARKFIKLQQIAEQVEQGDMPLPSYLIMHRNSRLSEEQKTMLLDWTVAMRDSMRAWYPPDSLQRRSPRQENRTR